MSIALLFLPAQSEAASGTKVDNGDGTYYFALPSGASTASHWDGYVQWSYSGQANFAWSPTPYSAREFTSDSWSEPGGAGNADIIGTQKIDDIGRQWTAIDYDEPGLMGFVAGYDFALGEDVLGTEDHTSEDLFDSTTYELRWQPMVWTSATCGARTADLWNGESRKAFSNPPTTRQNKVVAIFSSGAFRCSGVMIDNDTVLTVAHCLSDSNGVDVNIDAVCTRGNALSGAQCANDVAQLAHPKFDPTASNNTAMARRDIGVLKLIDQALGTSSNWMGLSRAKGSRIRSEDLYKSAFPGAGASPGTCSPNNPVAVDTTASTNGKYGYWDSGAAFRTKTSIIYSEIDFSNGESGSPSYYYPTGCCGSHLVTGVLSGGMLTRKRGTITWFIEGAGFARVRPVRNWILAQL